MLRIFLAASLLLLASCEPPAPPVALQPTPTPVSEAEIERAVRLRAGAQARAVEQGLANRRAEASAAQISADIERRLQAETERRNAAKSPPRP